MALGAATNRHSAELVLIQISCPDVSFVSNKAIHFEDKPLRYPCTLPTLPVCLLFLSFLFFPGVLFRATLFPDPPDVVAGPALLQTLSKPTEAGGPLARVLMVVRSVSHVLVSKALMAETV